MDKTLPLPKKADIVFIMPKKFIDLKKLVEETGTESQKLLIQLAEDYIAGLNNFFYDRDITELILHEFDFPMFLGELKHEGLLENKNKHEVVMLVMNVRHIVRHTWELVGSDGKTKTGDDLRKAWPLMWEDDTTFTTEQIFSDMKYM